jgi:RNA polymerase sigma factor (sigma-70 family)
MDDLMKLIRTYRLASALSERLRLAERIFHRVGPEMRVFVFGSVSPNVAEDALQEVLKAVAMSLKGFKGGTEKEFWGWCHSIARHKIADHYRATSTERSIPVEPEQLSQLMDASAQAAPMTPQNRLDLDYAMKLLTAAKPECSDLLWRHYVIGLDYAELAEENNLNSDAIRMRVKRCLDEAKALVA